MRGICLDPNYSTPLISKLCFHKEEQFHPPRQISSSLLLRILSHAVKQRPPFIPGHLLTQLKISQYSLPTAAQTVTSAPTWQTRFHQMAEGLQRGPTAANFMGQKPQEASVLYVVKLLAPGCCDASCCHSLGWVTCSLQTLSLQKSKRSQRK